MSSWTPWAKPADMTGTTKDLCPSKVFGSHAGYPKESKRVQSAFVEITESHHDFLFSNFKYSYFTWKYWTGISQPCWRMF